MSWSVLNSLFSVTSLLAFCIFLSIVFFLSLSATTANSECGPILLEVNAHLHTIPRIRYSTILDLTDNRLSKKLLAVFLDSRKSTIGHNGERAGSAAKFVRFVSLIPFCVQVLFNCVAGGDCWGISIVHTHLRQIHYRHYRQLKVCL